MRYLKYFENKKTYKIGDIVAYRKMERVKKMIKIADSTREIETNEYVKAIGEITELDGKLYIVKNIMSGESIRLTTKAIAGLASKQSIEDYKLRKEIQKYNL